MGTESTDERDWRGYAFILIAATLWGTTGTSQALAPQGSTPLAVGTMRLLVGGLLLLALAILRGQLRPNRAWLQPSLLASGVLAAAYQLTFFGGVALTGVAIGTVIGIGSSPIFSGILGAWLNGERLDRRWYLATVLAITGSLLLAFSGNEEIHVDPVGVLLALGAGLSYSLFTLVNKRLVAAFAPDAVMALVFCIGAGLMLPLLITVDTGWIFTTNGAFVVLHLGGIATAFAYVFYGRGLQRVPVSVTGTLTLAEPLTAALLGIFLLGEALTRIGITGMVVLAAGLLLMTTGRRSPAS